MIGRIGVHGLSQVLSTVLVFFVRYSVQLICCDMFYSRFAVMQQFFHFKLHLSSSSLCFHADLNKPTSLQEMQSGPGQARPGHTGFLRKVKITCLGRIYDVER